MKWLERLCVIAVAVTAASACVDPFEPSRDPVDRESFGTTVVTLACKRVAYLEEVAAYERGERSTVDVSGESYRAACRFGEPPPADASDVVRAFLARRQSMIDAVDATFPESLLESLELYLTSGDFLAMHDDGTTERAIDALVDLLELSADDAELAPALSRLNLRLGYLPLRPALGAWHAIADYPDLHQFLLSVTEAVTEGGSARLEFDSLVAAGAMAMRHAEAPTGDAADERTGALAVDLLLTERPLMAPAGPSDSQDRWIVRRDARGLASVALQDGEIPAPFVDRDGDRAADADPDGHFLAADGQPFVAPAPFALAPGEETEPWPFRDADERAQDESGRSLYDFVDLDRTVMGALARDAVQLFDPSKGTALDLLRGASVLVGPRQTATRRYGDESIEYRGYDASRSPLLDLAYGFGVVLTDPNADQALQLVRALFVDHEAEAAQLIEAMVSSARLADAFPDAQMEPGSPLFDDMMPVVNEILAVPGLAEDLMRALQQPEVAELPLRFAEQMKYRDRIEIDLDTHELVGGLNTEVDRSQADSRYNRSLFQRVLHLIYNATGVELCNKQGAVVRDPFLGIPLATYNECALLRIDDLAVFYLQAIVYAKDANGNVIYDNINGVQKPRPKARFPFTFNNAIIEAVVTDSLLESESGIEGFRFHPTPQALNRTLFLDPSPDFIADALDPPRDRDGNRFIDAHQGTLMVWELNGFYDQVRPIAQAFADHNAERLFLDLLGVVHTHYPSRSSIDHSQTPGAPGYAFASNLVSYEPLLMALFERRDLFDALVETAPVFDEVEVGGRSGVEVATRTARFLFGSSPGLARRDGQTSTVTEDGRPVAALTPWYLLAEAFQAKRRAIADAPSEGAAWQNGVAGVADVLLRADQVEGVGWRFRNSRFRGVAVAMIDFLRARLAAHDAAGDRNVWLLSDLPDRVADDVTGPVFAGAADFVVSLQADPEARHQLEGLLRYLVDEVAHTAAFRIALASAADLLQLSLSDADILPIVHVAGEALRPERDILAAHLAFARGARRADAGEVLVSLLRNLLSEYRSGHTPVGDLMDDLAEIHRARPFQELGERYAAEDYRGGFRGVAAFLGDERRGLMRFIEIVRGRHR